MEISLLLFSLVLRCCRDLCKLPSTNWCEWNLILGVQSVQKWLEKCISRSLRKSTDPAVSNFHCFLPVWGENNYKDILWSKNSMSNDFFFHLQQEVINSSHLSLKPVSKKDCNNDSVTLGRAPFKIASEINLMKPKGLYHHLQTADMWPSVIKLDAL